MGINANLKLKMKSSFWANCIAICAVVFLFITPACISHSKLIYFNDIDELSEPAVNPMKSVTISPFDKLSIYIMSIDQQTSAILNYAGQENSGTANGFVVDETGSITYPFVGKIHVAGLTLLEAGDTISNAISSIITKPVVLVSFIDNTITIMGEVATQGTYPMMNKEFINIYESLSLGGGLTQFADRRNIVLIRNEDNKMMHYKLDLSNSKIASSPLFYSLPNDIIIVEPLPNKSWNIQASTWTTILSSLSMILSIYYIISFNQIVK